MTDFKYLPAYDLQAHKACKLWGATNEKLAQFFEISVNTLQNWRDNFPSFDQAIRDGKALADMMVVEGLFKRATGMEYQVEKVTYDARRGEWVRTDTKEILPPDVSAALAWLYNRQPEAWKPPRQRTELTGKDGEAIEVNDVSARELLERRLAGISGRKQPEPSRVPQLTDGRPGG